ncbi:MAG: 50S ribosomal protein L18 [Candidatus Brennerbacteria bacterium]|nr:50S ribosomal protein L18 [Candidatus Brennerbacteria bacterium]
MASKINKIKKLRKNRTRAKIFGTAERPRFSVFRSNKFSYVQLIDDEKGRTIASASTKEIGKSGKQNKGLGAQTLGKTIAERALAKKIKSAVFDRGQYKYHGRVKSIAESAREAGLKI